MKKNLKKGFTLVELLVVIVLLGVIGAIVIYNMTSVGTSSKETDYKRFTSTVKSAAKSYANLNEEAFNELYVNKAYIYITAGQLIDEGLLDEKLTNPYTNKTIGRDEQVKASLDTTNGNVVFEYPVSDTQKESFLVAMSDYVVWGEPYDCMRGAGTYELAISDEDGNLIMLDDETIEKYHFTCSFPEEFTTKNYGTVASLDFSQKEYQNYKATNVPGNYEIEYSWITESGTRKKTKRNLRVESQVKPSLEFNDTSYDFKRGDNAEYYQNTYNTDDTCKNGFDDSKKACGSYNTLQFKPLIEGADMSSTKFGIFKKTNSGYGSTATNYVSIYSSDGVSYDTKLMNQSDSNLSTFTDEKYLMTSDIFSKVAEDDRNNFNSDSLMPDLKNDTSTFNNNFGYIADEGDKNYLISTRVSGHYLKDYYYDTAKEYTVRVELQIPSNLITSIDAYQDARLDHIYEIIYGTFNKNQIAYYEYRLSNSTPHKDDEVDMTKVFNISKDPVQYLTEIYNSSLHVTSNLTRHIYLSSFGETNACPSVSDTELSAICQKENVLKDYNNIYFRPINKEGYRGEWTSFKTLLSNLITEIYSDTYGSTTPKYLRYYTKNHTYTSMLFLIYGNQNHNVTYTVSGRNNALTAIKATTNDPTGLICPSYTRTWSKTFQTEDRTWTETYRQTISSVRGIKEEPAKFLDRENYSYDKLVGQSGTYGTAVNENIDGKVHWLPQLAHSGNNSYVRISTGGSGYAGQCLPGRGFYYFKGYGCCIKDDVIYIA